MLNQWFQHLLLLFIGSMLAARDIHACIKYILQDPVTPSQHPVGYLTSENRDTWAEARRWLMENNSQQIGEIDAALFNLVLDDVHSEEDPVKMTKLFLHGNGANRYMLSF